MPEPDNESRVADGNADDTRLSLEFSFPDAELVFGIVCAVGGNYRKVEKALTNLLKQYGYEPDVIRISEFLKDYRDKLGLDTTISDGDEYERIKSRMEVGNEARKKTGHQELLALTSLAEIASRRKVKVDGLPEPMKRTAHVLLTLKRPEEVDILRKVYGPAFFLIGVFATEQERLDYLRDDHGVSIEHATELVRKDREDDHPFGQQTRETFHRADVFVRLLGNGYKKQLKRVLDLVFCHPYHTPTLDEHSMYLAYSASLRSAQLGRQVGAAVISTHGDLIAVGCNEVPHAGGGCYWPGDDDQRDHIRGIDSNDVRKEMIANDIIDKLATVLKDGKGHEARGLLRSSLLFDITEFGRAVHAEMEALLSCTRSAVSTLGTSLFTTTFPCHNCTRHIIAAGVGRVVYIEPYPKSLATELHNDSIRIEESGAEKPRSRRRIPFEPFVGIGPRRYADLFSIKLTGGFSIERKRDGKTINWKEEGGSPRIPVQPISYLQREQLVAAALDQILQEAKDGQQQRIF